MPADLRYLRRQVGKAIGDYCMIEEGDHILVALSGGKDSIALLYILCLLRKAAPIKFNLSAATVDLGWGNNGFSEIGFFCDKLEVPYHIYRANLGDLLFEKQEGKNPCALCSHLRRGILCRLCKNSGCNKLALAHHADDAVETLFLNLFFNGQIGSFLPVTYLERQEITVVRPLIYAREREISQAVSALRLPIVNTACPAANQTRRQVKQFLAYLETHIPGVFPNLLHALHSSETVKLWPPKTERKDKKVKDG